MSPLSEDQGRVRTRGYTVPLDIHRHDSLLITITQPFSVYEGVTKCSLFAFKHDMFLLSALLLVKGSEIPDGFLVEEPPGRVLMRHSNENLGTNLRNECVIAIRKPLCSNIPLYTSGKMASGGTTTVVSFSVSHKAVYFMVASLPSTYPPPGPSQISPHDPSRPR